MLTLPDDYLLHSLSEELRIAPLNILREYMEINFLQNLSQSELVFKVIFYGGTALRLAYRSPRYSEDLDFLMIKPIKPGELQNLLTAFLKGQDLATLTDIHDKRSTLFALINVRHQALKHPMNIKIEISKKKNGLETEILPLSSPTSAFKPLVCIAKLTSLQKLKIKAMLGRRDPKDWFDFWYITKLLGSPIRPPASFPFSRVEFSREIQRYIPRNQFPLITQLIDSLTQK